MGKDASEKVDGCERPDWLPMVRNVGPLRKRIEVACDKLTKKHGVRFQIADFVRRACERELHEMERNR